MFSFQIIVAVVALFLIVGFADTADTILLFDAAILVAVAFFAFEPCCSRFSCSCRDDVAIDTPPSSPSTASDDNSDSGDDYKYAPTRLSQDAYLRKCKTFSQWIKLSRFYDRQRPLGQNAPNLKQHQCTMTLFEPVVRLKTAQLLAKRLPPFSYGSYSSSYSTFGAFTQETAKRRGRTLTEREEEVYWADMHWNDQCDQQLHLEIEEAEEMRSPETQCNQLSARKARSGRVYLELDN